MCFSDHEVINCGAEIEAQDNEGLNALDHARRSGYHNIEQLILFSQLNATVGNDIKNTAENIHKQDGIIDNILNELIEMELMINITNNRLSFDNDSLNLC